MQNRKNLKNHDQDDSDEEMDLDLDDDLLDDDLDEDLDNDPLLQEAAALLGMPITNSPSPVQINKQKNDPQLHLN